MRTTKTLAALTLCVLLGGAGPAIAGQDPATPPAKGRMEQELGLNADQAQQVRTIMQEQAEKRRALWKNTADRGQIPDQMRALHEETRQRLSAILNADQMARMEKHMQERHGRREAGPGDRMARELQLTPEQEEAVKKIFAESHAQQQALSGTDKDREQKRSQMSALHAQIRGKLATVLNADQLARFDKMHARHMERMGQHQRRHSSPAVNPVPDQSRATQRNPTPTETQP